MKRLGLVSLGIVVVFCCLPAPATASIYTGGGANPNDWFDDDNWGPSAAFMGPGDAPMLFLDGGGAHVGTPAFGATFGNNNFTFNQAGATADFLVIGSTAGQSTFTIAGGDLTYGGDGLFGINGFDGATFGPATINQTGGTLTQVGGGAGFLIGHSQAATYNLSGGSIVVDTPAGRQLGIDTPDFGGSGNPSFLNISGSGLVDVKAGVNISIGPAGVLDILDDGKLIWRSRTLADAAALGGTIRAVAKQVGPDIEFTTDRSPSQLLVMNVNRDTGAMSIANSTGAPVSIASYSIRSDAGTLNSNLWKSIAATGDSNSGGSIDPDDVWNRFTSVGSRIDLSEGTIGAATLANGTVLPLQTGAAGPWIKYFEEDVEFQYLLADGSVVEGLVNFSGNGAASFAFGDLDFDGSTLDFQDWDAFIGAFGADLTGLSTAEAYAKADLNGDGAHTVGDFTLFKQVFDAANGAGAFAAMLASVPEPSTVGLCSLAILATRYRRRRRSVWRSRFSSMSSAATDSCLQRVILVAAMTLSMGADRQTAASDYIGVGTANDWFDPTNWGTADFTGGAGGVVPTQAGSVGAVFGDVDFTFNEATPATSLYMIVGSENGNTFTMASGQLTYTGDGLYGSTLSAASGNATINHTGGTLIQTGGGAGFLVGHNASAQYNMTGGRIEVQATAASLSIDWSLDGTTSAPSMLHIGNGAAVDVLSPRFHIGPQGNLQVTGNGVLIWRNHVVADVFSTLSGGNFEGAPVIDTGFAAEKTVLARPIQVGNDVHFIAGSTVIKNLALSVNTVTGELTLSGGTVPRAIDFYQVTSANGALNPTSWSTTNLDAQGNVDTLGPGSGESWAAADLSSENSLTEAFLTGSSLLDANRTVSLGFGFDTTTLAADRDLEITVRTPDGDAVRVPVVYVSAPPGGGDFDGNGKVDGLDFLKWQRGESPNPASAGDFALWQDNFGTSGGAASATGVPEPGAGLLFATGLLTYLRRRRPV